MEKAIIQHAKKQLLERPNRFYIFFFIFSLLVIDIVIVVVIFSRFLCHCQEGGGLLLFLYTLLNVSEVIHVFIICIRCESADLPFVVAFAVRCFCWCSSCRCRFCCYCCRSSCRCCCCCCSVPKWFSLRANRYTRVFRQMSHLNALSAYT